MNDNVIAKKKLLPEFLLLLSGVAYYYLSYHTLRSNFLQVISLFAVLFLAYHLIINFFSASLFSYLLIAGFAFRLMLLFAIPNLSDDVYRFIWDGRLAANGVNPFSYTPAEIMKMAPVKGITADLYSLLNSPNYFAIYPPVLQGIFWLAAKLFPVNVFAAIAFLKCIIILAEAGNIFLVNKILKKLSLPKHLSLLYFLNPLVIIELSANAHFEGVMIFMVLVAILLVLQHNWQASATFIGAGIATKLLPVLFIPVIFRRLGFKKGMLYGFISLITAAMFFTFIIDLKALRNLLTSIDLFFRNFEFNASIYYAVRWVGEQITGYNIIAKAGPVLSLTASVIILFISFMQRKRKPIRFFSCLLFIISTWFLFSTTVHPWYICLPVALSVFTRYRFAMIWSFTALLSYAAYQTVPVKENIWLIGVGYVIMIGYAIWEMFRLPKPLVNDDAVMHIG